MAKVLNIYASKEDVPDLFAAIDWPGTIVWHWLAQGDGTLMSRTDSDDALPDPFQNGPVGMDICGTLPGIGVTPTKVSLKTGGERFVLHPVDIGDCIWFQGGPHSQSKMVRASRLFVHGAEGRLRAALSAAEKPSQDNRCPAVGHGPSRTRHLGLARCGKLGAANLAQQDCRMNTHHNMPAFGDCQLPGHGPI